MVKDVGVVAVEGGRWEIYVGGAAGVAALDPDEAEVAVHPPLLVVHARAQQLARSLLGAALAAWVIERDVERVTGGGAPVGAPRLPTPQLAREHRRGEGQCDQREGE